MEKIKKGRRQSEHPAPSIFFLITFAAGKEMMYSNRSKNGRRTQTSGLLKANN